jgi:chemotaxis protein CheY-P-specific phosphatase CheC
MSQNVSLSEDQRDCLQEIVNVAMGQAGDSLARFLEVFINLSVPRIKLVESKALSDTLEEMVGSTDAVSAVRQGFYSAENGQGIRGEAIVVFSQTSFEELAELLAYEQEINDAAEKELLLDITNILNGACLTGIAEQIETELSFSAPSILGHRVGLKELIPEKEYAWAKALLVEINYTLENRSFKCSLLLLMPGDAIEVVKSALDSLLDDFD